MSSEMRDIKALVDLVVGCISNGRRDEALLHAEQAQNALARALLARTEAGADGAVAWAYRSEDPYDGGKWMLHGPTWEGEARPDRREVVPLYTRPNDASGDADEVICEHSGCGHGPQANQVPVTVWPGDKVLMRRGRLGAAMQAKEAK